MHENLLELCVKYVRSFFLDTLYITLHVCYFRYLGVYIVCSRQFKCTLDYAKRSFYSAVNSVLGKLMNTASEAIILQLIVSKCMPIFLYGLEACHLTKADIC